MQVSFRGFHNEDKIITSPDSAEGTSCALLCCAPPQDAFKEQLKVGEEKCILADE